MKLEYFKKRKAILKNSINITMGAGVAYIFNYREPREVPDELGYKIVGEYPDIIREIKDTPVVKTKKKSSAKKA